MDWMGWDVGEVDLAARNRVLSSDELYEVNRQYWVALNARGTNVPRNRRERVALSLSTAACIRSTPSCAALVLGSRSTRRSCATPRGSPTASNVPAGGCAKAS